MQIKCEIGKVQLTLGVTAVEFGDNIAHKDKASANVPEQRCRTGLSLFSTVYSYKISEIGKA